MAVDLQRLRPTRVTLAALVGVLFVTSTAAVREFVWADLRDGVMRTSDLSRSTRAVVRAGFVCLFAMVGLLVAGDLLRSASDLLPTFSGVPSRGQQLPVVLFPVTLFAISVAWAFLLTGALHAHRALRIGILLAYAVTALSFADAGRFFATDLEAALSWATIAAVPVVFAARWRATARPAAEFAVLFALVAAAALVAQHQGVDVHRSTGQIISLTAVDGTLGLIRGLVTPLLILVGLDIADFMYRGSGWVVSFAKARLHRLVLPIGLAVVLSWRLVDVIGNVADRVELAVLTQVAVQYTAALAIPAVAVGSWWLVERRPSRRQGEILDADEVAATVEGSIPKLAFAYKGWLMLFTVALAVLLTITSLVPTTAGTSAIIHRGIELIGSVFTDHHTTWSIVFTVAVLAGAVWADRTGRRTVALYLGVLGGMEVVYVLIAPGWPLASLAWESFTQVVDLLTIGLVALAAIWAVRGTLTAGRVQALLLLGFVTALLAPSEVIGDPFSPFFAFAGVAFIAFGIVWDAITSGAWANEGTPRLPRTSRIFLYVGYVLLTVTILNWALATHDLDSISYFTDDAAAEGFTIFGKPLLLALFVVLLTRPAAPQRNEP